METVPIAAPAASSEAAPAAPATSAPASTTPAASERPTDVKSLAKFMETRAAATATPPAASTQEPAAIGQDAAAVPPPTAEPGPIPFKDHKQILENARTKATQEYREKYGWAEQVPKDKFESFAAVAQRMTTDPWGHVRQFVGELLNHPEHGKQGRSEIARIMSGFRGSAPVDLSPDLQVVNDQGQVTGQSFSAEKVMKIVEHMVGKEVQPLKQAYAQTQAEKAKQVAAAKAAEHRQQLDQSADRVMGDIGQLLEIADDTPPARKQELYTAINALLDKDPSLTPHAAAMAVRKSHVVPALQGKATQDAVDKMKQKAAGNTANAGAPATPGRLKDAKDIAAFLRARANS